MRITTIAIMTALLATTAWGAYVYEGSWGAAGTGDGQFNQPYGVACAPNGNVYVTDCLNHRVQYFTADGSFLGKWGSLGTGAGEFAYASGIGVAPNGNVYVADANNCRIQYFTAAGSFLGSWGSSGNGNGQFKKPYTIGIGPNGSVYVVDMMNHRVQYFTAAGSFLGAWGSLGSGEGQFSYPRGIAFGADGSVYTSDGDVRRVQRFTATGSFLSRYYLPSECHVPYDLARRADGAILTTNHEAPIERVYVHSAAGSLLESFGEYGTAPGQFNGPKGIDVGPANARVYVTDSVNNRVQYFVYSSALTPTSMGRLKILYK
jgi:tripartite motif-containing protein 71